MCPFLFTLQSIANYHSIYPFSTTVTVVFTKIHDLTF